MIPFLYNVAKTYFQEEGNAISNYTFVFPNRRSGVFFQHYLASISSKPIFSPKIITIADLFEKLSSLNKADNINILFVLYEIYKKISKSEESFDEFYFWGEMLVNDFDDVDKYLVNAKQLFQNIHDLKEIEKDFTFLSPEQIEAIRRFWSNFLPIGESKKKQDFSELWQVLYPIYTELKTKLKEKGIAYEGMIFREVVEQLQKDENITLDYERIVFVGLNAHSKSEEFILSYLNKLGIADFYWDYESELVTDSNNMASMFVNYNRLKFKSRYQLMEEDPKEKTNLEVVGIPSAVGQTKYVHHILDKLIANKELAANDKTMNTALILPDENLLLPVLYSIPEEIDKINITMGYGLKNSSISGLMEHIIELQKSIKKNKNKSAFYYKPITNILNHRFLKHFSENDSKEILKNIIQYNKIYISADSLNKNELFSAIFKSVNTAEELSNYLQNILTLIYNQLTKDIIVEEDLEKENKEINDVNEIEAEFVIEYYKMINRLNDTLKETKLEINIETYLKLLRRIVAGISVPFKGEPLSGLQIMGVLETRGLDFDNVILTSMNDGVFPAKKASNSFIPYNLRKGFDLPTYERQDAIFAYHFYRLINRTKNVYLIYDSRTEGMQSGEISRFYNQIKYLYKEKFNIEEKLVTYEVSVNNAEEITILKDEKIIEKLKQFQSGGSKKLSASSINTYLDCPLKFYFTNVEGLREEDEVAETIENNVFGNIFHKIMEWIYKPFKGKQITADLLESVSKNEKLLTQYIEKSFAENFFKSDKIEALTGQNYLIGEVIRKCIKQVLMLDSKLTPFYYLATEERINQNYRVNDKLSVNITGFIDRVDEVNKNVRIIDYKTGQGELGFKTIDELFDKTSKKRPKAVMQVFMYAHLYMIWKNIEEIGTGIYFIKDLFSPNFDPYIENKQAKASSKVIHFSEYRSEFETAFNACLEEIFDPTIPFTQTEVTTSCEWCPFNTICRK